MQSSRSPDAAARPAFRRRGRIVFTLLAVLVSIGLAPLATVAWKLIATAREALTTSHRQEQRLLTASVAYELDIHVDGVESQLVRVAQTLGVSIQRHGATEVRSALEAVVDPSMPYLRYARFAGTQVRSTATGELPEVLEPLFDSAPQAWAEILARGHRRRSEDAIFSDPIVLEGETPRAVLVVSSPVVSGGKLGGVLSALVELQPVLDAILAHNRTGHQVYALDTQGRVFASSAPLRFPIGEEARRNLLVDRFLSDDRRGAPTTPFTEPSDAGEERYLGSFEVTDQGWGIFVQAPLSKVYTEVNRMAQETTIRALIVLGLAVLAAVVFAGTLSRPINTLAAASRSFASGDYSARVEFRSGSEVGELAHTFNVMADEIEEQIRKLRRAAEENRELFLDTIRAMAQAIDAKDPYTRGHSVRVNRYSVILARQLGLSEEEMADIHVASLMHDVGKIGIDDNILKKPGKLTTEEFEIMKTHTVLGANIIGRIRRMKPVLPGLRWHHERWGGGGYPDGLVGEQIPQMARIVAVADAFDAMTTHRPYQRSMTFPQALARLNELKGTAFQEEVVEAFNRAYHQGRIRVEADDEKSQTAPIVAAPVTA